MQSITRPRAATQLVANLESSMTTPLPLALPAASQQWSNDQEDDLLSHILNELSTPLTDVCNRYDKWLFLAIL